MRSRETLIIFTKDSKICRVKTRLYPYLSHRECLFLHKQSLLKLLNSLLNSNYNIVVYSSDVNTSNIHLPRITVKQQQGIDLGTKMHNAMVNELKTAKSSNNNRI